MNSNTVVERSTESEWSPDLAAAVTWLASLGMETLPGKIFTMGGEPAEWGIAKCPACGDGDLVVQPRVFRCRNHCTNDALRVAFDKLKAAKAEREKLAAEQRERDAAERKAEAERRAAEQKAKWEAERAERERQAADERREQVRRRNALPERLRELYGDLERPTVTEHGTVTARCPVCGSLGALSVAGSDELAAWCRSCDDDDVCRALGLPTSADEDSMLDDEEPEAPEWLVAGAVVRGHFITVVGKTEAGKSLVMLDWAIQMANQGERVLYLDAENPPGTVKSRLGLMGAWPKPAGLDYRLMGTPPPLDTPAGAAELARLARTSRATVVVLDTWSKFITGSESAPETHTRAYVRAVHPLKLDGLTIVAGDHLGKDKNAGPRGGSSKTDNADQEWTLTASNKGAPAKVTLAKGKGRNGPLYPDTIQLQRLATLRHVDLAGKAALPPKVAEMLHALEISEVPRSYGRDRAAAMLRDRGFPVSTDALAVALRDHWKANQAAQ